MRRCSRSTWGDVLTKDARAKTTWARIPHIFQSPYYVYQYATCFASTAELMGGIRSGNRGTPGGGGPLSRDAQGGRQRSPDAAAEGRRGGSQRARPRCARSCSNWTGSSAGWKGSWCRRRDKAKGTRQKAEGRRHKAEGRSSGLLSGPDTRDSPTCRSLTIRSVVRSRTTGDPLLRLPDAPREVVGVGADLDLVVMASLEPEGDRGDAW